MVKIYSPNKGYNGISATVNFINGVGETDNPHLIYWFKESGYIIEDTVKEEKKKSSKKGD